jgi:hypothetical protein
VALKVEMGSGVGEWGAVWGVLFLWSFCVFVYISVVEVSVCVMDCRGFWLFKVGIVGCLVGNECEGGRGSLVTG